MFASLLLPAVAGLHVLEVHVLEVKFEGERFSVEAETTQKTAVCPGCQVASHRIHSHYRRKLADLPWAGCPVELVIKVHRFRCQNTDCGRRIFCERLTPAIEPMHGR